MVICEKCGKEVGNNWYDFGGKSYCKKCLREVSGWYNCSKCGKELGFSNRGEYDGKYYCQKCRMEFIEKDLENIEKQEQERLEKETQHIPKLGVIKCPYCGLNFKPERKKPTSTVGNIGRGIVFLPWGIASSIKNKPYVECPHCHMRIPQG